MLIPLFCKRVEISTHSRMQQVAKLFIQKGYLQSLVPLSTYFSPKNEQTLLELFAHQTVQECNEVKQVKQFLANHQSPFLSDLKKDLVPIFSALRNEDYQNELLDEPFVFWFCDDTFIRVKAHFCTELVNGMSSIKIGVQTVSLHNPNILLPKEMVYFATCINRKSIINWLDFSFMDVCNLQVFVQTLFNFSVKNIYESEGEKICD